MLGEDGTSERVRFDNMIYVLDGQYTAPLDQVWDLFFMRLFMNNNDKSF